MFRAAFGRNRIVPRAEHAEKDNKKLKDSAAEGKTRTSIVKYVLSHYIREQCDYVCGVRVSKLPRMTLRSGVFKSD